MNRIIVVGNLGRDPEVKTSSNDTKYCKFSVAVQDGYGEKKTTTWIDVVTFGKRAENAGRYLAKGSKVLVEGRLKIDEYEKDGQKRKSVSIVADNIEYLSTAPERPASYEANEADDDIPF